MSCVAQATSLVAATGVAKCANTQKVSALRATAFRGATVPSRSASLTTKGGRTLSLSVNAIQGIDWSQYGESEEDKVQEAQMSRWGAYTESQYPSESWIEECRKNFPEKGVADVEEARTLCAPEIGYTYLDIRAEFEQNIGRVDGSVSIPLIVGKYVFMDGERKLNQAPNRDFLNEVQKKFPNKDAKICVGCSDGANRAIQALIQLDKLGYTNIVGVKGGFNAWVNKFDFKLNRKRSDGYAEKYDGDGSDSALIHSTGAGFARMDAIDRIQIRDPVEWINWE